MLVAGNQSGDTETKEGGKASKTVPQMRERRIHKTTRMDKEGRTNNGKGFKIVIKLFMRMDTSK